MTHRSPPTQVTCVKAVALSPFGTLPTGVKSLLPNAPSPPLEVTPMPANERQHMQALVNRARRVLGIDFPITVLPVYFNDYPDLARTWKVTRFNMHTVLPACCRTMVS